VLLNPPHPKGKGFTREGRCTQESGAWATQWPPLSLATCARVVERDGHNLRVIDCPAVGVDRSSLAAMIKQIQPDFVFWNTATPTLKDDLALAETVRKAAPHAVTGVYGTHVTVLPEVALQSPCIDAVIRGEPEQTTRELCACQDGQITGVQGISYKHRRDGKLHHNPDRGFLPPEDIPSPAWYHLDTRPYRLPISGKRFLIIAPIRGCPFDCSFCTASVYYGKKLRKRPIQNVVDEIEENIRRFKVRDFLVWADTFTANRKYIEDFCHEILGRALKIFWTCNSRVDTVDKNLLSLMKQAGLWMISFGLESGNIEILKRTRKKIDLETSEIAVTAAHQLGIRVSGHFMLGLPGETEKTLQETLDFALGLPLDIAQFYAAAPFPGTEMYEDAVQNNWLRADSGFSQSQACMDLPGLPAHRVDAFRRRAFRAFYMRPRILRGLLAMARPGTIRNAGRELKRCGKWAGLFE